MARDLTDEERAGIDWMVPRILATLDTLAAEEKFAAGPLTTVTVQTTPGLCLELDIRDKDGKLIPLPYSGDAGDETAAS